MVHVQQQETKIHISAQNENLAKQKTYSMVTNRFGLQCCVLLVLEDVMQRVVGSSPTHGSLFFLAKCCALIY